MIFHLLLFAFIFPQDQLPFKPNEEFEIKLNYSFKQRPSSEHTTFRYDTQTKDRENQNSSNVLPYLVLNLKVIKASASEVKLKVVSNLDGNVFTKKIQTGSELQMDMGFTDDVKDRVTAHEYIVYFLNEKKKEEKKIVIFVEADGTFRVNGEVRGKL